MSNKEAILLMLACFNVMLSALFTDNSYLDWFAIFVAVFLCSSVYLLNDYKNLADDYRDRHLKKRAQILAHRNSNQCQIKSDFIKSRETA